MHWDYEYREQKHVWGTGPSELAVFAAGYMREHSFRAQNPRIIDLGCGYGRDVFYLAQEFKCNIVGVDKSPDALKLAEHGRPQKSQSKIEFRQADFLDLPVLGKFDAVCASNIYHLLRPQESARFRETINSILNPRGLLFLSVMSVRDPQHHGKGTPVDGEINSWVDKVYLHLSTEEELRRDFGFVTIGELQENLYDEPRSNGEVHHHMIWLLAGEKIS